MDNVRIAQVENTLAVMRLLVEGALSIYEDETSPLFRLALNQAMHQEASAFSILGTALYELRTIICLLQKEHEAA